LLKVTIKTER